MILCNDIRLSYIFPHKYYQLIMYCNDNPSFIVNFTWLNNEDDTHAYDIYYNFILRWESHLLDYGICNPNIFCCWPIIPV